MKRTAKAPLRWIAFVSSGAAILAAVSPLAIPLAGGVPLTLASLAVMLLSLVFGAGSATASAAVYLALGAVGLPVFSGGTGGVGRLFGVTGGFLFGYLALAVIAGAFRRRSRRWVGLLLGNAALYAVGVLWYCLAARAPFWPAVTACVLPFLPGDAVKCALALYLDSLISKLRVRF